MSMARNNYDPQSGRVVTRNASTFINLVSCSSEHFILAIKRESVAKVPNVDAQGKPTVRFKELSSIYKDEDANKLRSDQTFSWQTNRSRGSSGDCQVKLELASPEEGDYLGKSSYNLALDDSEGIFRRTDADVKTDHDGDELNGMTLKEFKIRCKKQKAIKSDVSGETNARSHTYVFQCRKSENSAIEPVEVESDLEEPLIILKEKLSKKNKLERKRKKCAHPYSPDSVVSTQELNEQKQSSCFNAAQHFISIDGRSPEHAVSVDNTVEFHLKNIKEEVYDSLTDECSALVSIPKQNFPDCTITQMSEEVQRYETETSESESSRSNILNYSIDDILCSENYQLDIGIDENAMETYGHAFTSVQEQDPCSISCPEITYNVKKEILEPDSLSEQEEVSIGHCFAYDTAECHLPGRSLDEALDWSNRYEIENIGPSAEKSQCSSIDEVPIEHPLFNHQISLQESAGKNFEVRESSFSPLICSSDPVPVDHGSELSDSSRSTIRVKKIMLEAFDPAMEQKNGASCCTQEICSKADNSMDANVSSEGREDDANSTYGVPSQNIEMDSSSIDYAKTNVSNDVSSRESEISVNFGNRELAGEMPTDIPGEVQSPQTTEHSNSKTYAACTSKHPNLLCSSTNCLNSIDAFYATEEKLMATMEEKMYYLKVHEESACSNGFLHPVDIRDLEAVEGQKCHSQNCDQLSTMGEILLLDNSPKNIDEISTHLTGMFSNGDSNQPAEVSSYHDVDGLKEDEAPRYTLEHPPIKLLSNRKALSPTSQEKLCQAVDAESDKVSKSGKKLLFEKRTSDSSPPESGHRVFERLSSPERIKFPGTGKRLLFEKRVNCNTSEPSHRVRELMLSPERASKKQKNGSVPLTTKGILKSPLPSMKPCSCVESSLIRKHTQEVITFSQRQMHDIESLAMKLVKGLVSMKSIVETALNSEDCSTEPLKYNADEMRIAIDSASELEDTTKRWLSMMGRDCNRFCRILRSTVYKTAAPTDVLRKDRKKITFADEAGGTLCHVKVFEGQTSSSADSEHQEVDPFPQTLVHQLGN